MMFGNRECSSSKRIQIRYHLNVTTQRGTRIQLTHSRMCVRVCVHYANERVCV